MIQDDRIRCGRNGCDLGTWLTRSLIVAVDGGLDLVTTALSQIWEGERPGVARFEHRCPTPGWTKVSDEAADGISLHPSCPDLPLQ